MVACMCPASRRLVAVAACSGCQPQSSGPIGFVASCANPTASAVGSRAQCGMCSAALRPMRACSAAQYCSPSAIASQPASLHGTVAATTPCGSACPGEAMRRPRNHRGSGQQGGRRGERACLPSALHALRFSLMDKGTPALVNEYTTAARCTATRSAAGVAGGSGVAAGRTCSDCHPSGRCHFASAPPTIRVRSSSSSTGPMQNESVRPSIGMDCGACRGRGRGAGEKKQERGRVQRTRAAGWGRGGAGRLGRTVF